MKTLIIIAGSDPTSGAGLQSDILTAYENDAYPFTVTTSITTQNAYGVTGRKDLPSDLVKAQLEDLLETYVPDAIKIGMLGSLEIATAVCDTIKSRYPDKASLPPLVVDPVMISSSGKPLLDQKAIPYMLDVLFSMATLVTPNKMEFDALFTETALRTHKAGILLKGGHYGRTCVDTLLVKGRIVESWESPRLDAVFSHGTGCTLSTAIAANLANGFTLIESIGRAKSYLTRALENPILFDNGFGALRK